MLASDRLFCLREKAGSYLSKLRRDFIGADFQPSRLTKSEANRSEERRVGKECW